MKVYHIQLPLKYNINPVTIGLTWLIYKSETSSTALGKANLYTFEMVKTSAIRVDMTAQAGKGLGITEIKIFSKSPAAYSEPNISDIRLDGKSILNDFIPTGEGYENTVMVAEIPHITATGPNHTSITVLPTVKVPSTAKVIAKSEDGKKTVVYNIHLR